MDWLGRLACYTLIQTAVFSRAMWRQCKYLLSSHNILVRYFKGDNINLGMWWDNFYNFFCKCLNDNTFRYEKEEFDISINGETHLIKLIDTAGQEDYDKLRKWFYKEANCFILCYDISNHASYTNISDVWLPELKSANCSSVPIVLVGSLIFLEHWHNF